jgi:tetratricopeptide (TPR) repeat protein
VDVQTILAVATPMLEGEILYREGEADAGLAKLRAAVQAEDALRYFEPPAWFLPVRHALGAALMQSGRFAEAEDVYREDLRRFPGNGWSQFGLAESLRARGEHAEFEAAMARFRHTWRNADIVIQSSCLCLPGA